MSILVACIMYNKWQNNTKERHAKAEGKRRKAKAEKKREQARDKAQRQKKSIASSQKWTNTMKGICPYSRTPIHTQAPCKVCEIFRH